jgi:hypothetical protein
MLTGAALTDLPSVAEVVATFGCPVLERVTIPPSRNGFYTDRAEVFIKENTGPLDAEYVAAMHAWRSGIPTPQPLAAPVTAVRGDGTVVHLAPYRYHAPSPEPVTVAEAAAAITEIWQHRAPAGLVPVDWHVLVAKTEAHIDALADPVQRRALTSLSDDVCAAISDRVAAHHTGRKGTPRLVYGHGDAHYGNIMRDLSGQVMLIDWGGAALIWPEMDAAKYAQSLVAVPAVAGDPHRPDGNLDGFIGALPADVNIDLLEACARLRALNTHAWLLRWQFTDFEPSWEDTTLALAVDGFAAFA